MGEEDRPAPVLKTPPPGGGESGGLTAGKAGWHPCTLAAMKLPSLIFLLAALFLTGCAHTRGSVSSAKATAAPAKTPSPAAKQPKKSPSYATVVPDDPGRFKGQAFRVRTTAYTGTRNAVGGRLQYGAVTSAASDWSHFPLGTKFRIRETGKVYLIDDYGSALVGTHTIDLAQRGERGVNAWGVRWVNIDILEWGSPRRSLEVLAPRKGYRHIRPMIAALRTQSEGVPARFHRIRIR